MRSKVIVSFLFLAVSLSFGAADFIDQVIIDAAPKAKAKGVFNL